MSDKAITETAVFKISYVLVKDPYDSKEMKVVMARLAKDFEGYAEKDIVTSMHYHGLSGTWLLIGSALLAEGIRAV